jgi:DNA-binding transcriptional MerR regulator
MPAAAPSMFAIGSIARRLNAPVHRIEYIIRSRGITPAFTAGNARVFTEADVQHIASELRRIDQEREGINA